MDRRLLGTKRGHRKAITVTVTRGNLQADRRKADAAARGSDLHLEVDRRLLGMKRGHRKAIIVAIARGDLQLKVGHRLLGATLRYHRKAAGVVQGTRRGRRRRKGRRRATVVSQGALYLIFLMQKK